jgi:hypothetical protein
MMIGQRKFSIAAVVVVGMMCATSLAPIGVTAEGVDFDDGYVGPDHPEIGYLSVEFRQQDEDNQLFSWVGTEARSGTTQEFAACSDVNGDCIGLAGQIEFTSVLPPCTSDAQNNCIVGIFVNDSAGNEVVGNFDSFFPDRGWNDFVGDESKGIPSGGPASIWKFPGVTHAGGDDFFVRVGVSGKKVNANYVVETFQAGIWGVSPIGQRLCIEDPETRLSIPDYEGGYSGLCGPRITYIDEPRDGRLRGRYPMGGGSGTDSTVGSDCVMRGNYQGAGVCMTRRAFSGEMRFRLVVRLQQYPKGWLHGRISDPDLSFVDLKAPLKGVQISVTGTSVAVPVIQSGDWYASLPAALQKEYAEANKWRGFRGKGGCCTMSRAYGENWQNDMTQMNFHSYPTSWGENGIDELVAWLPYVGDKATANLSSWSVRTLSTDEMREADQCLQNDKGIVGFVSTNATQYSAGPPKYNKQTGTLDYRVAAPHYRSGGGKFFGIYHLIMKSDLARCLYGFSKAPLNASISVVDDEGVTTTGTRNISEKDGWIKIAALGFGFSTPTVKVKFAQVKSQTIVCVKGKATKKVTGAKPVCPKGWKKK